MSELKNKTGAKLGLALIFCPVFAAAEMPGSSGADFLIFGQGPRAIAMGESQTAVADDAYAAYWNPAGLSLVEQPQAAFTHNKSVEGMDLQYLSLAWPVRPGSTLNLNLTRFSASGFEAYDAQGVRKGSVEGGDTALGLAYGHDLLQDVGGRPMLSLGANAKGIQEELASVKARTLALDLGALAIWRLDGYRSKAPWLGSEVRVGFTAQNLGPGLKFDRERSPLPTTYRVGLAWQAHPSGDPLTLSIDQVLGRDQPHYVALGMEYVAWRLMAFRAGFRSGQDIGHGFRGGVGFKFKTFDVDYAFAGFGELGSMHRVGILVRFGRPVETTPPEERALGAIFMKAARFMHEQRYYEAVLEYSKILNIDPTNEKALEGMKRAHQSMPDR
jgi:hypothetical protein